MQDQQKAKQQIVDRLRQATNILVTVENNPSVDELTAALALTLMLNKMEKHATAVFSGAVPPAISFLEPQKTFEHTVDSLRDFIIALDKEKADRLRYKVENDVVKIFITPYRSVITRDDLQFSQGDFNVEVIVALGVERREDLDRAIVAHGRILHDATIITINARDDQSSLGAIDWQDGGASSISEMLFGLSEALQPNVLDQQISTAMLTGIVAATERFSNQKTSPKVMTMAAQLMAAGANQQLIANNLTSQTSPRPDWAATPSATPDEHVSEKLSTAQASPNGEMKVVHPEVVGVTGEDAPSPVMAVTPEPAPTLPEPVAAAPTAEPETPASPPATPDATDGLEELKRALQNTTPVPVVPTLASFTENTPPASTEPPVVAPEASVVPPTPPAPEPPKVKKSQKRLPESETPKNENIFAAPDDAPQAINARPSWQANRLEPPTMGGTLNATTADAEDAARRAEEDARNRTLLSHDESTSAAAAPAVAEIPAPVEPAPAPSAPEEEPRVLSVPTDSENATPPPVPEVQPPAPQESSVPEIPAPAPAVPVELPAAPADQPDDLEAARQAVNDALGQQPFNPADEPLQSVGAQPLGGELHPSQQPAPAAQQQPVAAPGQPAMPPMPDFSTLPPLPPPPPSLAGAEQSSPQQAPTLPTQNASVASPSVQALPQMQTPTTPGPGQVEVDPNNPAQFQIPGQQ